MPWSEKDYPVSMKNLTPEVRNKAIEIANALLEEGTEECRAIAIATAKAEEWAENRDKPIKKDGGDKNGRKSSEKSKAGKSTK